MAQAALTRMRAHVSVEWSALATSTALKTTGADLDAAYHYVDDGLRNERPFGRSAEGRDSEYQSGSEHRGHYAQHPGSRYSRWRADAYPGVQIFSFENNSFGGGGSRRGNGAAADPGGRRHALFCGAGQRSAFRNLRPVGIALRVEHHLRTLFQAAGEQHIPRPRYFCAGGGVALEILADREFWRGNHRLRALRDP